MNNDIYTDFEKNYVFSEERFFECIERENEVPYFFFNGNFTEEEIEKILQVIERTNNTEEELENLPALLFSLNLLNDKAFYFNPLNDKTEIYKFNPYKEIAASNKTQTAEKTSFFSEGTKQTLETMSPFIEKIETYDPLLSDSDNLEYYGYFLENQKNQQEFFDTHIAELVSDLKENKDIKPEKLFISFLKNSNSEITLIDENNEKRIYPSSTIINELKDYAEDREDTKLLEVIDKLEEGRDSISIQLVDGLLLVDQPDYQNTDCSTKFNEGMEDFVLIGNFKIENDKIYILKGRHKLLLNLDPELVNLISEENISLKEFPLFADFPYQDMDNIFEEECPFELIVDNNNNQIIVRIDDYELFNDLIHNNNENSAFSAPYFEKRKEKVKVINNVITKTKKTSPSITPSFSPRK